MKSIIKKKKASNENVLIFIIVLLTLIISLINPNFLTVGNFMDMIRSSIVTGIFAIGAMLVIISGGIDISFPAIAAFAMYSTTRIFNAMHYQGNILLPLLTGAAIGIILGMINAFLIYKLKIPTLIATIGTSNLFSGILLTFIGSGAIMILPKGFVSFAKANLIVVKTSTGISSLPIATIIIIIIAIATWYILKFTLLGRGVYALGGSSVSAERIGFSIGIIHMFIYSFVGATAGIGGVIYTSLLRTSNPFDVLGTELTVIAAVVLGGARVSGGYGSVKGTLLGVFLITMINNSLILLGVSTYWQRAVLGLMILIGTGMTAVQKKVSEKQMVSNVGGIVD